MTHTAPLAPFAAQLAAATHLAQRLPNPLPVPVQITVHDGSDYPQSNDVRVHIHYDDMGAADHIALRLGLVPTTTSVTKTNAHRGWAGDVPTDLGRVHIRAVQVVDLIPYLQATVDGFDELPEQGPNYSAPRPALALFTPTAHETRLDELLTEAAAAEDIRPRDEELIASRYAAARRYAHAAGIKCSGCLCGRDAEHAPTVGCVWKQRPVDADHVHTVATSDGITDVCACGHVLTPAEAFDDALDPEEVAHAATLARIRAENGQAAHGQPGHAGNPGNCAACHAEEFGDVLDLAAAASEHQDA
jgi:hypothetical protein